MKKKRGFLIIELISMMIMFCLYAACMYAFNLYKLNAESEIVSDSMISSNLAAFKDIDKKILGADPTFSTIVIEDPNIALQTYKRHLKYNLSLDNDFKPINSISFIKGRVDITKFIVYNVAGNDIIVHELNTETGNFLSKTVTNGKNVVMTPKGFLVSATTIHSEIGFDTEIMFGHNSYARKSEDTDITK